MHSEQQSRDIMGNERRKTVEGGNECMRKGWEEMKHAGGARGGGGRRRGRRPRGGALALGSSSCNDTRTEILENVSFVYVLHLRVSFPGGKKVRLI